MIRRLLTASAFSLVACTFAFAQTTQDKHPYDIAHAAITQLIEENKKKLADDPDKLVLESLIADRKLKRVDLYACASTIGANDALEFFVTPAASGKDYEAIAVTWAKPSDVHKALEFIGMKPGRPVKFAENQFWTRGPRVIATFNWDKHSVRAEEMVVSGEALKPLPLSGLVFTGSFTHTDEAGKTHYAADQVDSRAIAPNYNDPAAVLDVPNRLSQGEAYGFQKINPAHAMKPGTVITISLAPGTGDDAVVSRDIRVIAAMKAGEPTFSIAEGEKSLADPATSAHLVTALAKLADGKTDLFTTTQIDPAMPIAEVRKLYAVLSSLERDRGVKLDPPPAGQLYHRAFFPDPAWRNRQDRLGEPWELFLTPSADKLTPRLERQVENFSGPAKTVELQKFDPQTPEQFVEIINKNQSQWSQALFVYIPDDVTYGQLQEWTKPALPTYPRVYVFPPEPAKP